MLTNDHSTKRSKSLLVLLAVLCATFLSSCGRSDQTDDPTVKIIQNTTTQEYLLPKEVEMAPSGELRLKENGKYLDRKNWKEKEVLKSKMEGFTHHET